MDYDFEAFFRKYIPDTERCQAFTPVRYNESRIVLDMEDFEGEPLITCYGPTYSRPELARRITKEYE